MIFIWLGAILIFLLVESNTVSLVSLWFAVGSLGALIVELLGGELWLQILVFVAVSAILLACLRPLVRKWLKPRIVKTNVDAVVGKQGYVTADVDNIASVGQVKLGGMEWSARSTSGEPIPTGALIQADRVEGVKVFVSVVENKE